MCETYENGYIMIRGNDSSPLNLFCADCNVKHLLIQVFFVNVSILLSVRFKFVIRLFIYRHFQSIFFRPVPVLR